MIFESYIEQQIKLPISGQYIVGQFSDNDIIVYQAFSKTIANYAVQNQKFGGAFYSFNRMSWIKPGFMWMMYRSGWAQKENQERILSIRIKMTGFLEVLNNATHSSYQPAIYASREVWERELKTHKVRLQWDPDHNPKGIKLDRKAIQLGMKGEILKRFNDEWILEIEDITDFVDAQRNNAISSLNELVVPAERVLFLKNESLQKRLGIL